MKNVKEFSLQTSNEYVRVWATERREESDGADVVSAVGWQFVPKLALKTGDAGTR